MFKRRERKKNQGKENKDKLFMNSRKKKKGLTEREKEMKKIM